MFTTTANPTILRKAITRIASALTIVGGLSISLSAEEFAQDGLRIQVDRAETAGVAGYSLFRVSAENPTEQNRTLHAVIELTWTDPEKPEGPPRAVATCVAYLEIPAGHRLTEAVPCKGDQFSAFSFQIKSVLPYILDRTPLRWQKSEPLNPTAKTPSETNTNPQTK